MFAIQQRLAGRAHQTFQNFKGEVSKIDEIFAVLAERFAPARHPGEILADFWEFKQPPSMTVSEYLAQARQKVRAVTQSQKFPEESKSEMEEKWLLAMLLKNLDVTVRRGVIARNPVTLAELETFAKNEEKAILATQPPSSSFNPFAAEFVAAATVSNKEANSDVTELREIVKMLTVKLDSVVSAVGELSKNQGEAGVEINQGISGVGNSQGVLQQYAGSSSNVNGNYNLNGGNNFSNYNCHYCNLPGHFRRNCPQLHQAATWAQTQQFPQEPRYSYPNRGGGYSNGRGRGSYYRGNEFQSRGNEGGNRGGGWRGSRGTGYDRGGRNGNGRGGRNGDRDGRSDDRGGRNVVAVDSSSQTLSSNSGLQDPLN